MFVKDIFTKNRIILIICILLLGLTAIVAVPRAFNYLELKKVAKAAAGMPWQDGGIITMVREPCVLDTPAIDPVECGISCPLVTSVYHTACVNYIEIDVQSQFGTTFIAAPVGFQYRGGGAHPRAGIQYIAGGASNVTPWIIAIPR